MAALQICEDILFVKKRQEQTEYSERVMDYGMFGMINE